MKRMLLGFIGAALLFTASSAVAAEAVLSGDLNSAYVWRGITFNDGAVFQPAIDVSHGGFGVNVWGNLDIDDYNGTLEDGEFSEVDLTLSYGFPIGPVDVSFGYIEYLFPHSDSDGTREVFVGGSISPLENLSLGADLYYDFDEVEGFYAALGASYGFEPMEKLSLEAGVVIGIADNDFSTGDKGGFHEINLSLSGSYVINDSFSVGAMIAYTNPLDNDVLPEQDVDFYGGVNASYSF